MSVSMTQLFLKLGSYLGHSVTSYSDYRIPVFKYNKQFIIDINTTTYSLQQALYFVHHMGKLNCCLLFIYPDLYKYPVEIRLSFVSLVHAINGNTFDTPWVYGQLSNSWMHVLSIVRKLFFTRLNTGNSNHLFNGKNFFELLTRVVFFTYFSRIDGVNWETHFIKIVKYWKFIYLYKHFKSTSRLGDFALFINKNNNRSVGRELSDYLIPVIGLVDTSSSLTGITYPIFTNDDSIILNYFILKVLVCRFFSSKRSNFKTKWLR